MRFAATTLARKRAVAARSLRVRAAAPSAAPGKHPITVVAGKGTVAIWHHPRFSSGTLHVNEPAVAPFWQALYEAGAELVLSGHEHFYERLAPMRANGVMDQGFGLRSFIVGTGGFSHYGPGTLQPASEARNADTFGVLKLTLRQNAYDWQFVPEAGKTYADLGTGACHGRPA